MGRFININIICPMRIRGKGRFGYKFFPRYDSGQPKLTAIGNRASRVSHFKGVVFSTPVSASFS
jgi:hypothetical protein